MPNSTNVIKKTNFEHVTGDAPTGVDTFFFIVILFYRGGGGGKATLSCNT